MLFPEYGHYEGVLFLPADQDFAEKGVMQEQPDILVFWMPSQGHVSAESSLKGMSMHQVHTSLFAMLMEKSSVPLNVLTLEGVDDLADVAKQLPADSEAFATLAQQNNGYLAALALKLQQELAVKAIDTQAAQNKQSMDYLAGVAERGYTSNERITGMFLGAETSGVLSSRFVDLAIVLAIVICFALFVNYKRNNSEEAA
jgi:hypothetical protein